MWILVLWQKHIKKNMIVHTEENTELRETGER